MTAIKGIVHGNSIELEEELGLPGGERVAVVVQRLLPPGEGIRRSAGAWADAGEELNAWLEQVYVDRGHDREETRNWEASWRSAAMCILLTVLPIACLASETSPPKRQTKVTISKETTYILGPLRPDGYPDYLAAVNQQCSKGVTTENNAVVPLRRAVGPVGIETDHRPEVFKLLGMEQLPYEGAYLESFEKFAMHFKGWKDDDRNMPENQKWQKRNRQAEEAKRRPWSQDEFPAVAAWLKASEKPLELIIDASRRARFYMPLVAGDGLSITHADYFASVWALYDVTKPLIARAMLRLNTGDVDGASQDLMACHRLVRLVAQVPFGNHEFCASEVECRTCIADAVFAHSAKVSDEQRRKYQEELRRLPPLNRTQTYDFGERLWFLSDLSALREADSEGIAAYIQELDEIEQKAVVRLVHDPKVDWNRVHRISNLWFDKLVEARRNPTYTMRKAALEKLESSAQALRLSVKGPTAKAASATEQIADVLVGAAIMSLAGEDYTDAKVTVLSNLRDTAFALAAYRSHHNSYPVALKDLAPTYVSQVSRDAFADQDVLYRRQGKGYVLYSVGLNGKDDGGRDGEDAMGEWQRAGGTDYENMPKYDDIVIRTPEEE